MLSKTYILAWAAFSILLLGSCRTEKSKQEHAEPNKQKPKASETVLPTTFRFSIRGAPSITSYTLVWDGETLTYETSGFVGAKITKIVPSAEQWRAFWEKMEEVKVWEWRPRYYTKAYDGVSWGLVLQHGGKIVKSSGSNAYPPGNVFKKFMEAVRELAGKEAFPWFGNEA